MVQEKCAARMHPSRTSIPRELLVESVRQPYDIHDVHAPARDKYFAHTRILKCRDKSWTYQTRWILLDNEHTWVDCAVFGQY
jgi:hypothetical protein